MTTHTDKAELRAYVDGLGLQYTAMFQPRLQPVETVKDPQLHWRITLSRAREKGGVFTMECDYSQGIGHVIGYQYHHKSAYDARIAKEAYRKTCETGKLFKLTDTIGWMSIGKVQPAPALLDVLYCLVSDADVLNYPTYEQWAPEFGYDPDSRKGEEIYRKCIEQTLALLPVLGGQANLEKLRELFQDY